MDEFTNRKAAQNRRLKLSWPDLLAGKLSARRAGAGEADGGGVELHISGKLSDLFDDPRTPLYVDMGPDEVAEALAGHLYDALLAASRKGLTVTFEVAGKSECVDGNTSERKLGGIERELARALTASRHGMAAAAQGAAAGGHALSPAWLGVPTEATDGAGLYAKGRVFNWTRARGVWAAFDRYLEGDSLEQIADFLNSNEYRAPGGDGMHEWTSGMVAFQLNSPAAIGLPGTVKIDFGSSQAPEQLRPALLGWPTFRLVQDLRRVPREGGRRDARNLLSGRVFCARCRQDSGVDHAMVLAGRSAGTTLVCSAKGKDHPGPRYEEFEAQILQWLQDRDDILPELDRPLAVTDDEAEKAIQDFSWPPPDDAAPRSLEDAVRRLRAGGDDERVAPQQAENVKSFLERLKSEPMSAKREELRRKLRNVLRRHVARVHVGAINGAKVDPRSAVFPYARRETAFIAQDKLQSDANQFEITVGRVGQAEADPPFTLSASARATALSARSFELPQTVDWEEILLRPQEEQTEPRQDPGGVPSGGAPAHTTESAVEAMDGTGCTDAEFTGYQPRFADSEERPWGVHICAQDLDALAADIEPLTPDQGLSDLLAFGMLLRSLELLARVDDRLLGVLRTSVVASELPELHGTVFAGLCPVEAGAVDCGDIDDTRIGMPRKLANKLIKLYPSDRAELKRVLVVPESGQPRFSLKLTVSLAAALEGLRWAQAAGQRLGRSPQLADVALDVIRNCAARPHFVSHPLSLFFESDFGWEKLAAWLADALPQEARAGGQAPSGADLRRALQAQTFPPCGPRPAPVYLHGSGRVANKIRSALGMP